MLLFVGRRGVIHDGYYDCNLEGLVEWEESLLCIDQRPETRGPDAAQLLTPIPRVSGGQEFSCSSLRQILLSSCPPDTLGMGVSSWAASGPLVSGL